MQPLRPTVSSPAETLRRRERGLHSTWIVSDRHPSRGERQEIVWGIAAGAVSVAEPTVAELSPRRSERRAPPRHRWQTGPDLLLETVDRLTAWRPEYNATVSMTMRKFMLELFESTARPSQRVTIDAGTRRGRRIREGEWWAVLGLNQ